MTTLSDTIAYMLNTWYIIYIIFRLCSIGQL